MSVSDIACRRSASRAQHVESCEAERREHPPKMASVRSTCSTAPFAQQLLLLEVPDLADDGASAVGELRRRRHLKRKSGPPQNHAREQREQQLVRRGAAGRARGACAPRRSASPSHRVRRRRAHRRAPSASVASPRRAARFVVVARRKRAPSQVVRLFEAAAAAVQRRALEAPPLVRDDAQQPDRHHAEARRRQTASARRGAARAPTGREAKEARWACHRARTGTCLVPQRKQGERGTALPLATPASGCLRNDAHHPGGPARMAWPRVLAPTAPCGLAGSGAHRRASGAQHRRTGDVVRFTMHRACSQKS